MNRFYYKEPPATDSHRIYYPVSHAEVKMQLILVKSRIYALVKIARVDEPIDASSTAELHLQSK
jgi:hypothetical protein